MIDWSAIDTVLLDMDGTLLDLHFDNYFWMTHLPRRYAEHHGLPGEEATRTLHQKFHELRGTLNWYCLDFWSEQLAVDIRTLKHEIRHLITERPHALNFLERLGQIGKSRILITNAHPDSLSLKLTMTGIAPLLDNIISSHQYQTPKEDQAFWRKLQSEIAFEPERTLFIDDSVTVLTAAREYGIGHLFQISQPDSKAPPCHCPDFEGLHHFDDLLPPLAEQRRQS